MKRSTPLTWEQVRVGALLLLVLAVAGAGVFYIGQTGHVFGERYRLVTLMNSAAGIVSGASVQLAGQNVGQVSRVEWIEPDERPESGEAVAVWLAVNEEVRNQIRTDSRARVRTQGLLGDRLIDIEPGSADARVLQPGDTLVADQPLDFQEVLEQANDAVGGLTALSERLEELTRRMLEGEGSLGQLVVNDTLYRGLTVLSHSLADVLRRAEDGEGSLGLLLTDDRLYRELVSVTAQLDTVSSRVVRGEGSLGLLLSSDTLYRELESVATRSDSLLARVEAGRGAAGQLMTDERLYEELLRLLVDVNALIADVRERPERYVPPVEVF